MTTAAATMRSTWRSFIETELSFLGKIGPALLSAAERTDEIWPFFARRQSRPFVGLGEHGAAKAIQRLAQLVVGDAAGRLREPRFGAGGQGNGRGLLRPAAGLDRPL